MRQPGLKHYCKNCDVDRYWSMNYDNKWCPKCKCIAPNNMRCKIPEMFEPKYTLEQRRTLIFKGVKIEITSGSVYYVDGTHITLTGHI